MEQLSTPYGEISLARYPSRDPEPLLAYDAADRYLLAETAERHPGAAAILVVGDRHGALTTALAGAADVTMWADSALSRIATRRNLERNARTAVIAEDPPERGYDLVVVRPGKARALLAAQLAHVAPLLADGTPVVAGDMVKHLGRWMTEVLEEQIGDTTASLARGKARLLRAVRDGRRGRAPEWTGYEAPGGVLLHNAPGCFASSGLDAGTRLLLRHLPTGLGAAAVADLGCGNGVLAITSARSNPDARYLLVDESAAAIDSARRSWTANLPGRDATFTQADGLADAEAGGLDVVLCNPPFHAGTTVDEWVGVRLLEQARRALRPGGALYVVANRHLRHHRYLRDAFAAVDVLGADARFSVLRATR